jgi:hypothetical protein
MDSKRDVIRRRYEGKFSAVTAGSGASSSVAGVSACFSSSPPSLLVGVSSPPGGEASVDRLLLLLVLGEGVLNTASDSVEVMDDMVVLFCCRNNENTLKNRV